MCSAISGKEPKPKKNITWLHRRITGVQWSRSPQKWRWLISVCSTYQQQLEVARNNLESQEEILRINEAKLAAGLTSNLTVAQSKGLWLQTKATLPGLEASVYSEVNTLAVLTGEYSDSLRQALLQVHPLPQGNPILMQGIPGRTDPAAPGCPLGRTDDGCTGSRSRRNTGRLVAEILPNGCFRVW